MELCGAVMMLGLLAGALDSAEAAGRELAAQVVPMLGPVEGAPHVVTLRVDPPDDTERLKDAAGGLRAGLQEAGVVVPAPSEEAALRARILLTLRALDNGEGQVLNVQVLSVESGQTLGTPQVTLAAGVLPKRDGAAAVPAADMQAAALKLGAELRGLLDEMPGELRYQRVAVVPFEERGAAAREAKAGRVAALQLERVLVAQHRILVVERTSLQAALEQQQRAQAQGDPDGPQLGRMLDAQALILGEVSEVGDRFVVHARVVDVERGAAVSAAPVSVPRRGVVSLASGMVELQDRQGAVFRSLVLPGWGQWFVGRKLAGGMFLGAAVVGVFSSVLLVGAGLLVHGAYMLLRPPLVPVALVAEPMRLGATGFYVLGGAALVLGALVWGASLLDAWVLGGAW